MVLGKLGQFIPNTLRHKILILIPLKDFHHTNFIKSSLHQLTLHLCNNNFAVYDPTVEALDGYSALIFNKRTCYQISWLLYTLDISRRTNFSLFDSLIELSFETMNFSVVFRLHLVRTTSRGESFEFYHFWSPTLPNRITLFSNGTFSVIIEAGVKRISGLKRGHPNVPRCGLVDHLHAVVRKMCQSHILKFD